MPSKTIDSSQDWSTYDLTEFVPLDRTAIQQISSNFKIEDHDTFELSLRTWSSFYRNNVLAYASVPSWAQRRALFQELEKSVAKANLAFDALGSDTLSTLRQIPLSQLDRTLSQGNGYPVVKTLSPPSGNLPAEFQLDLELVRSALQLLHSRAAHFKSYYETKPENMENLPPLRDMARRTLISNIAEYWHKNFETPFTRRFSEYNEIGEAECKPINDPSRFAVACAQAIDPELTASIVKNSMMELIKDQRTQKPPK